jgi:hypothetical protein
MLSAEEQDIVGPGTLIEIGSELLLVEAVTGGPPATSSTVRRAMYGTTAAAHAAGDYAYIAGDHYIPRHSVFTAVADAVDGLWPDLWTVAVEETWADSHPVELPSTVGEIMDIRVNSGHRWSRVGSWEELQNFPLSSTGVAFQSVGVPSNTFVQVYYKKIPTRPTAEADTLAALGVEESWVKVVVLAAVASLISNTDLSKSSIDFITEGLAAEGFQVGQGADIRNALLQFQDFQLRPLKRALAMQRHDRVLIDKAY